MKFICLFVLFCALALAECTREKMPIIGDFNVPEPVAHGIITKLAQPPARHVLDPRMSFLRGRTPTVRLTTKMGSVDGSLLETCRRRQQYAAFFGMPYAKAPIGNRRFMAPLAAEPWDGVYDATFERPTCMQYGGQPNQQSEDCLYLNVYTPSWESQAKPKSVMVFIHGGAFLGGSSNFTVFAPDLFIENDVILVTMNYRLGAFGFLSLQTAEVPGNAGLKDQKLALEWVRDNIKCFGGDPNSVTIFGESAGSASVNYHVLSKASKGLFHKAIMESGMATSPWALNSPEDSVKFGTTLAKKLGCPTSGSAMVDCLRKTSAYRISEEQEKTVTLSDLINLRPYAFLPTKEPNVEGAFITEYPIDILSNMTFNQVPTIVGANSREGLLVLPTLKSLDPMNIAMNLFSYSLGTFFPEQLRSSLTDGEKNYLNTALRKFYSAMKPVGTFNALKMIDIVSDIAFVVPIQFAASALARGSQPVYSYIFSYDGPYGYFKTSSKIKEEGVCHGDELGYIFYDPEFRYSVNEPRYAEAEVVANTVMFFWTNFAKTGNPTPENAGLKWPALGASNPIYAEIGKNFRTGPELGAGLDARYKFWMSLINEMTNSSK